MKIRLLCVGKITDSSLRELISEYSGRVQRYFTLETQELKEEKGGKKADRNYIVQQEGEQLLTRLPSSGYIIALDERGKSITSEGLADIIGGRMLEGTPELCFVIGGAYGLTDEIRRKAHLVLSLSAMTFTHQMARLFLLEQIYRSLTILRNEPYHNR